MTRMFPIPFMDQQEVWSEVMAPGGDTMRFIDDQLDKGELVKVRTETRITQPFRRDVEELEPSVRGMMEHVLLTCRIHPGNQCCNKAHPWHFAQLLHLVADQCDQWRNHKPQAGTNEGRQLKGTA